MPAWSVRLIRGALVYLVAGAMIGAMLLSAAARGVAVPVGPARALHAELLLFGWLVQFTMGVAYWMMPKHATGPERGPVAPIVAAWLLLNAGVWLAGLGQALLWPDPVVIAGRAAEAGAVLAFAVNLVPRVKAFGAGRSPSP
jgi:heme/copper-type cytochrome/quinol oxidase subunit 1